ncbi:YadA-like family protein [Edwardsiella piscicida]|uniref:YadA-like family protein n=1 Tax=Edwardsiella piscicida TaxID=1263550 RepID=UPI0002C1453F|nr:YadA C-terminal domain-containing protein [Edwardsiella piscicida]AGH73858.1 hypothetical protein ETAC_08685 [Edwardsiella piscicida C07-087]EKS7781130.1 YadA-like family protein [Edwardsiella piscicida]EKS7784359.1 YadA-like family protein [Edwardsiella piscicida]UCQ22900.1 YadA-like family protein [Edwardsiella piscicida]UCQ33103.1 YadA-like family protein [Edwardsiella piscicida]
MMKNRQFILLLSLLPLTTPLAYAAPTRAALSGSYQAGGALADSQNAIALGNGAHVTTGAHSAVAVGVGAAITSSLDGIAIGSQAAIQGKADGATAIGSGSQIDSNNVGSNAIGINSHVHADAAGANAIGDTASVGSAAAGANAIGTFSRVGDNASGAVALGSDASVGDNARSSVAIGDHASVASGTTNAVSIGDHSTNQRSQSVSFGDAAHQRQLTHVAAGTQSTDAVNLGQLNSVAKAGQQRQQQLLHNSVSIHANQQNIAGNSQQIDDNGQQITANAQEVRDNGQRIHRNAQTIQRNWRAVNAWQSGVSRHLGAMQHQIDNNRHEMRQIAAKDAALAGLFQPYSIGKFNASAALGGYKDQQAVAVGVGYRFTHQLAAKAGAAFNDNSLEYNVGVNYEFN